MHVAAWEFHGVGEAPTRHRKSLSFDHDCCEGICGACSLMVNGQAHGPELATTTCRLHMRHFHSGHRVTIEPWCGSAFPVVDDLVGNRSAFDRFIQSGCYVSVSTDTAPEANAVPVPDTVQETARDVVAVPA